MLFNVLVIRYRYGTAIYFSFAALISLTLFSRACFFLQLGKKILYDLKNSTCVLTTNLFLFLVGSRFLCLPYSMFIHRVRETYSCEELLPNRGIILL